jgi:uncharacterized damage-inducible protein DinB
MSTLYRVDDRRLLADLLGGANAFLGPSAVLDGLTAEQAQAKPHGLPHSIAELVAHMSYWQEWFNGCAAAGFTGMAEHAAEGWPAVPAGAWDAVRERYFVAIQEAERLAATSERLAEAVLPPGVDIPPLAKESCGSGVLQAAMHSGHHLGQIVTIRQLLGLWPPPSGSMTW